MKNLKTILAALLVAGGSFLFDSCKKEDLGQPGADQGENARIAKDVAGNVFFKAINPVDKPVAGVKIHIGQRGMNATQYPDLVTNEQGIAVFRGLANGTYFYRASKRGYPSSALRTGYVTVDNEETEKVILTFE